MKKYEEKLSHYINESKKINPKNFRKIKIGILSSFTIKGLAETLRVKCYNLQMNCITYESGYNQINQDLLDSSSEFYKFESDLVFLFLDVKKIFNDDYYFFYKYSIEERKKIVEQKVNEISNSINSFLKFSNKKIIISNLPYEFKSSLGILDSKNFGISKMILEFNRKLEENFSTENSVLIFDLAYFYSKFGSNNISEPQKIILGDMRIGFEFIPHLANELIRFIKPMMGLNKKCIVLDLDNTLWGGIVGEDGFDGIRLGPETTGKAFMEFQKTLLALNQRGIILAINSKNNYDDAIKVIREHPYMILKEENFASIQINWEDKVTNMKRIAQEINIGLDSMVFMDDDPVNCQLMRDILPSVKSINLPNDSSLFVDIVNDLDDFEILEITSEDRNRGRMYFEQKNRVELKNESTNLEDYLKKLETFVTIKSISDKTISRISQLTLKTNQFNLTTKRYSEEQIKDKLENNNSMIYSTEVKDKFGDNGITGVFIIESLNSDELKIDSFLLSCRVIGRNIERTMMNEIINKARILNKKRIIAEYIPTKKNLPAKEFLGDCGFINKNNLWIYDVSKEFKKPTNLEICVE